MSSRAESTVRTGKKRENETLAWFVPMSPKGKKPTLKRSGAGTEPKRVATSGTSGASACRCSRKQASDSLSLQEAFRLKCALIARRSERRVNEIHVKATVRERTAQERYAEAAEIYSKWEEGRVVACSVPKQAIHVPRKRVFTQREMRLQTQRIYGSLPEVKEKRQRQKREEQEKTHRLMASIYTNRLKQNALKGRVTWPLLRGSVLL
jgi:hypothetical protein